MINKKGIELSINFLVIIILSIAIFSFSIFFLRNLFTSTEQAGEQISSRLQEQTFSLLAQGKKTAIPINKFTLSPGGSEVVGLGMNNVIGQDNKFIVEILDGKSESGKVFPKESILYDTEFIIENNDQKVTSILIKVPTKQPSEEYIIDVRILSCDGLDCDKTEIYGLQKLYIKVE